METPHKQLSDLIRYTELVSGGSERMSAPQKFSIVSSLKTNEYLRCLNEGKLEAKEYLEVAQTRLENIEWREFYDRGFVEGLKFNWSNGC